MKNRRQRGELALTLSLLGIFITVLGVGLGARMSKDIQQSTSRASGGTYTYKSTLEIRDENGAVIPWESGMTWSSNLQSSGVPEKSAGDIKMPNDPKAHVIYDATGPNGVPEKVQNFSATITLNIPDKYEIVKSFCENRAGTSCAGVQTGAGPSARIIPNIRITSGAEIVYGLVIRQAGSPDPSCRVKIPECKPKNVRFGQVSENNVTIKWDNPANCPAYTYDQDRFWIDVIRPGENGTKDTIVCATDSGDTEATCTLGKAVPAGREIDKNSQEFTSKEWDQNRSYTLKVYLHNNTDSCLSEPSSVSFSYTSRPPTPTTTATPTATPTATETPTPTVPDKPTAIPTAKPTEASKPTPVPTDDVADLKVHVKYRGTYLPSSTVKHQFYLESCENVQGSATKCGILDGRSKNSKTGVITLIKSDAKERYYGMTLKNVSIGSKMIVLRHLIDGNEARSLVVLKTACSEHASPYECPFTVKKGQKSEIWFDVTLSDVKPDPKPLPTETPQEIPIKHISGNGPVRVVVIPVGFSSIGEFEKLITEKVITTIRDTNIAHQEREFTYLMVDSTESPLECEWTMLLGLTCLSRDYINSARVASQSNYAIVIKNLPEPESLKRSGGVLGSTDSTEFAYGNNVNPKSIFYFPSFTFSFKPDTLIHEYGHGFAGLADEYVFPNLTEENLSAYGLIIKNAKNCSEIKGSTCKWGDKGACLEGCLLANYGRSSDTSMMNNKHKVEQTQKDGIITITKKFDLDFNPISLEEMNSFFAQMKARVTNATFNVQSDGIYMNALHVSLVQTELDSLQAKNVETLSVYPQEKTTLSGPRYTISVLDVQNKSLYETSISKHIFRTHSPEPLQLNNPDLYLPFFPEADHIVITNEKGETILTINLADYGPMTAVEGASACGNSFCDAALGETATSCRADCGAHLAYSELERADINGDGVVNGVDLALVIDTNTYRLSADGDIDGDLQTDAIDYTILLKWMGTETN